MFGLLRAPYIPSNIWTDVEKYMKEDLAKIKMGGVEDFTNFVNAVIDKASFTNWPKP